MGCSIWWLKHLAAWGLWVDLVLAVGVLRSETAKRIFSLLSLSLSFSQSESLQIKNKILTTDLFQTSYVYVTITVMQIVLVQITLISLKLFFYLSVISKSVDHKRKQHPSTHQLTVPRRWALLPFSVGRRKATPHRIFTPSLMFTVSLSLRKCYSPNTENHMFLPKRKGLENEVLPAFLTMLCLYPCMYVTLILHSSCCRMWTTTGQSKPLTYSIDGNLTPDPSVQNSFKK